MQNRTRIPAWLIGGVAICLAYVISLSILLLWLLSQWVVAFPIRNYSLPSSEYLALIHTLLLCMVAPGFFILYGLSFLHIHIPWVDAANNNWRTMALLSSLPAFIFGTLIFSRGRRVTQAGAVMGLLSLGGSLIFILNLWLTQ